MSRSTIFIAVIMFLGVLSMSISSAQTPPPPDAPKEARLAYWGDVMKAATARIEVIGADGEKLGETYGVTLGDPPRLVTRLTPLAGADKVTAHFPGGEQATADSVFAFDPVNDIAVLSTTGSLPNPPEPDDKIKWRYREKVYVIPAPGMDQEKRRKLGTGNSGRADVRTAGWSGEIAG